MGSGRKTKQVAVCGAADCYELGVLYWIKYEVIVLCSYHTQFFKNIYGNDLKNLSIPKDLEEVIYNLLIGEFTHGT